MLLTCSRGTALTPEYVNSARGLELQRFRWPAENHQIGALPDGGNHLAAVQEPENAESASLLHWPLGEPWFQAQRTMSGALAAEWFVARDEAFCLFE